MLKPWTVGDGHEEEKVNNPCEGNRKSWISKELNVKGWLSIDVSITRAAEEESWNARAFQDASAGRKRSGIGARKEEEKINAIKPSDVKKRICLPKAVSKWIQNYLWHWHKFIAPETIIRISGESGRKKRKWRKLIFGSKIYQEHLGTSGNVIQISQVAEAMTQWDSKSTFRALSADPNPLQPYSTK